MAIIRIDLTLFLISVLGRHRNNLQRKMYTKQPLRTSRLVVDMSANNSESINLGIIKEIIGIIRCSRNN